MMVSEIATLSEQLGIACFQLPLYLPTTEGENEVWFQVEIEDLEVQTTGLSILCAVKMEGVQHEMRRLVDEGQIRPIASAEPARVLWSGLMWTPSRDRWIGRFTMRRREKVV